MPPWQPAKFAARLPLLQQRGRMTAAIRDFFTDSGFMEVETPLLQISPGLEPHIMAFGAMLEDHAGNPYQQMYLHTSPEFSMKKLLVAGAGNIFTICKTFRNRERATTHSPEFTMMEWYRSNASYWAVMDDCVQLLRHVATACDIPHYSFRGKNSNPHAVWQVISVADAFWQYCKIDLLAMTAPDIKNPPPDLLAAEARRLGVRVTDGDNFDDVFYRIFPEHIEPHLGTPAPTLLYDYPIHMAALSRPKAADPRLAERFELYVCGLELANAFGELTDAAVQNARFKKDMDLKEQLYGFRYPIDRDFIAALEHGMPESSGIALGIDRLAMLTAGADDINDVLWLPVAG